MSLDRIKDNYEKMKRLSDDIGEPYYTLLGEILLNDKLSIQDAIDECYYYFFGVESE